MTATLTTLLNGYSLSTGEGSPAFCSVHLVESAGEYVLFDCGHAGRRRKLLEALTSRDLEPADIGTVVLSHAHWDHIQNVDFFAVLGARRASGRPYDAARADASIERVASLTGVVCPGHDAPFRIGRTPEYVVRSEPLVFRGRSRAIFEETS